MVISSQKPFDIHNSGLDIELPPERQIMHRQ